MKPGRLVIRQCSYCNEVLRDNTDACPRCGNVIAKQEEREAASLASSLSCQDAVMTSARRLVEQAIARGDLTLEQAEFLSNLLLMTKHVDFGRRREFVLLVARVAQESNQVKKVKAVCALRDAMLGLRSLEDLLPDFFRAFGI